MEDQIGMVQECVSRFEVKENEDGSTTITVEVPNKFTNLWLVRLSGMRTTLEEIELYSSGEQPHEI
jgi:hypothetical protein